MCVCVCVCVCALTHYHISHRTDRQAPKVDNRYCSTLCGVTHLVLFELNVQPQTRGFVKKQFSKFKDAITHGLVM